MSTLNKFVLFGVFLVNIVALYLFMDIISVKGMKPFYYNAAIITLIKINLLSVCVLISIKK